MVSGAGSCLPLYAPDASCGSAAFHSHTAALAVTVAPPLHYIFTCSSLNLTARSRGVASFA
jgi:hypothetical protein